MELIDKILLEWSHRVHDGMPNPKNPAHLVELRDTMRELNIQEEAINLLINNLNGEKQTIVEVKGDTSATTFYHEVITGIVVGGGRGPFKTGEDVKRYFDDGTIRAVNSSLSTVDINKLPQARFLEKDSKPKSSVVSDAIKLGKSITKELGKGRKMMWTGPTNDKSKFGAADIAGSFGTNFGDVGVSLKAGKGQLKNLTVNTFFKALGLPQVNSAYFLKKYKKHWDAMCNDWVTLVEKTFESKLKGEYKEEARSVFSKHAKKTWNDYQKESFSKDELQILNDALGTKINKTKFRDFCRKLYDSYGKEWNEKRDKHFDNIFKDFSDTFDGTIRTGLHDLFKRQLSVGKTSLFYAAKGGKTFWFIPSEKLYDRKMGPEDFIADYETKASGSGYDFYLDVGTQETGAVGTIKIIFRWKQGQMVGFPDTTSDYKLVTKDWSPILGAFRK
jgi:hypothetical protein